MGLVVSLLSIPLIKKLITIHREIDGKWFRYLRSVLYLWKRRTQNKTNRVVTHDYWKDDMRDLGVIPFEHEWTFDTPNRVRIGLLQIVDIKSNYHNLK